MKFTKQSHINSAVHTQQVWCFSDLSDLQQVHTVITMQGIELWSFYCHLQHQIPRLLYTFLILQLSETTGHQHNFLSDLSDLSLQRCLEFLDILCGRDSCMYGNPAQIQSVLPIHRNKSSPTKFVQPGKSRNIVSVLFPHSSFYSPKARSRYCLSLSTSVFDNLLNI